MRSSELIFISLLAFSVLGMLSVAQDQGLIPVQSCGVLNATGSSLVKSNIGSHLSSVSFLLNWTNATSSLDMILSSPSGLKIDSSAQPPVIYGENESMEYYIVPNPEPGTWTVQIRPKSVPDKGEEYCLSTIFIFGQELVSENNTSLEQLNTSALNNSIK